MGKEKWRDVPGYDGLYEVSDRGRIRRLPGTPGCVNGRILRSSLVKGYPGVMLYRDTVGTNHYVHRVVMAAFVGPCPAGHNVNHRDAVKTNNWLTNLHYATFAENMRHAHDLGIMNLRGLKGEENGRAIITNEQALSIVADLAIGDSPTKIAQRMGINRKIVYCIKYQTTWKHLDRRAAGSDC